MPSSTGCKSFTPKAFHIVAQGRRAAAHPGLQDTKKSTLKGSDKTAYDQELPRKQDFSTCGTLSGFFFL